MTIQPTISRRAWPSLAKGPIACGFTLVEMLVTVAIASILLGVAVPAYNGVMLSTKLSGYTSNLVADTLLARGEAIRRNAAVALCVSSDGASCGAGRWEQGWLVMCKTSDHVVCDDAGADTLVIQYQPALSAGWKISEANALTRISFDPTGTGATAATLTLCRATPTVGTSQRAVRISASGRPSVTSTTASTCA